MSKLARSKATPRPEGALKRPSEANPRAEGTGARVRPCMACRQAFRSEGIHNRLCLRCTARGAAPDPLRVR